MNVQFTGRPSHEQECSICWDKLQRPYALFYSDVFCTQCIGSWLRENNTCPLCRRMVPLTVKNDVIRLLGAQDQHPHANLTFEELEDKLREYLAMKANTLRLIHQNIGGQDGVARSVAFDSLLSEQIGDILSRQLSLLRASRVAIRRSIQDNRQQASVLSQELQRLNNAVRTLQHACEDRSALAAYMNARVENASFRPSVTDM